MNSVIEREAQTSTTPGPAAHQTPLPLSAGSLPLPALQHDRSTAVAELLLDDTPVLRSHDGSAGDGSSVDAIVLVRVHGDPVGVAHVAAPPADLETTLGTVWNQLGPQIAEHVERHRCAPSPVTLDTLHAGLGDREDCPGAQPRPRPTASQVAVIIPTTRGGETLRRCLHSFDAIANDQLEIIVVDNAPSSGNTKPIVEVLTRQLPGLRYVAEPRPGSSVARNRGIAETSAQLIAFTDDDVVIDENWLGWLLDPFADPAVMASTGLVMTLSLQTAIQKQFELYAGFSKGVARRTYDNHENRDDARFLYPYWGGVFGSGNSMAFRRSALLALDGFDPALGAGSVAKAGADIEIFSRVVAAGWQLVYEPRSICWHEHRGNPDALERQVFDYGVGLTAIFTKHLLHDPQFLRAAARGVPQLLRHRLDQTATESQPGLGPELTRRSRRGQLLGPVYYARSVRWARLLQLEQALYPGSEPTSG